LSADSVGRKAQAGGHALHAGLNADSVRLSADGIRPQARRPAPHVGSGTDAVRTKRKGPCKLPVGQVAWPFLGFSFITTAYRSYSHPYGPFLWVSFITTAYRSYSHPWKCRLIVMTANSVTWGFGMLAWTERGPVGSNHGNHEINHENHVILKIDKSLIFKSILESRSFARTRVGR